MNETNEWIDLGCFDPNKVTALVNAHPELVDATSPGMLSNLACQIGLLHEEIATMRAALEAIQIAASEAGEDGGLTLTGTIDTILYIADEALEQK